MARLRGRVRPLAGPTPGGLTRDERTRIDAQVDAAFPGLREGLEAGIVAERQARSLGLLGPGERCVLTEEETRRADTLKRDLLVLVGEIGVAQTGAKVDPRWIFDAARRLGEEALGVVGWSMGDEQVPEAMEAVVDLAKRQLVEDRRNERCNDDDIPF